MQVQPALLPITLDRPFRHTAQARNLGERQPAEELQLNHFGEVRFDVGELVERIVDAQQRVPIGHRFGMKRAQ